MSMSAILTLRGMVNYKPDLFENLQLPVAPADADELGVDSEHMRETWSINKSDFVDFLCFQTESMSLVIPDYTYLKKAIGTWSKAHIHEWQKMFDTLFYKYNPLWNKDYNTQETEAISKDRTNTQSSNASANSDNNNTGYTHGYDGGASTETDPMNRTNTLSWTNSDKTIGSATTQTTNQYAGTEHEGEVRNHSIIEQGNIGVTTVQEMIEAERNIAKYSIEEYIADEFKKQFCIMLW